MKRNILITMLVVAIATVGGWYISQQPSSKDQAAGGKRIITSNTPKLFTGKISGARTYHLETPYKSYGSIENAVAVGGTPPRTIATAGILGNTMEPTLENQVYRIRVAVPAFAQRDSKFVVGLFFAGSSVADVFREVNIRKGSVKAVEFDQAFEFKGKSPIGFQIRVGVGAGGKVFVNGDESGVSKDIPQPKLIIEKYGLAPL